MSPKRTPITAVTFMTYGGVEVLDIVEIEKPVAGPGEVVVEVLATGINHVEAFVRQGLFKERVATEFPQRQGSDFAGLVSSIGPGVSHFAKGSEVLGHANMTSHATFIVVPQTHLVAKPASLSWEVAGSLFLAGLAASDAIQGVNVGQGETVVISAAAGGVGSMEAHLAMHHGATVIGTCGARNFDYLRQIGVKPVVYGEGLADRIRAAAPRGIHAYIDNFGGNNPDVAQDLGVSASRFRSSGQRREIELNAMHPTPEQAKNHTRVLADLAGLAANRTVNVLISGFYPFAKVREAFEDLEQRHARGKIVLGMRPVDNSFHGLGARKVRDDHERS